MKTFCLVVVALLVCVGCGSPSIVGKWNMAGANTPPGSTLVTEFMDSTFTARAAIEQSGVTLKFEFSGDYTFDGKKLKMVGKSAKIDESSFPAAAKAMIPSFKADLEKSVLTTQEGDAKLDGDVLTFTVKEKTTTFTRIK